MDKFEIRLKNEKIQTYKRISWIIIIANMIGFIICAVYYPDTRSFYAIGGLGLCFFLLFLLFYFKRTKWQLSFHAFFFVVVITWTLLGQYWIAAIMLIFDVLQTISTRELLTVFSKENIKYPSFPAKTIEWNDLNNTILKDGLLTIDLRNNKLIQQPVDEKLTNVNEQEFNEFCNQQLKK